jgi:hypothetical protein
MFLDGSSDHSVGKPAASSAGISEFKPGPVRAGQLSLSEASAVIAAKISSIPDKEIEEREQRWTFSRAAGVIAENSQEGIENSKRRADLRQRLVGSRFRFNRRTKKSAGNDSLPIKKTNLGEVGLPNFIPHGLRKETRSFWMGRGKMIRLSSDPASYVSHQLADVFPAHADAWRRYSGFLRF